HLQVDPARHLSFTACPYTTLFRSLTRKHTAGPAVAYSRPPSAGPARRAVAEVVPCRPRALGSTSGRTSRGRKASAAGRSSAWQRSEEHTSELQSRENLVCRLLLEK